MTGAHAGLGEPYMFKGVLYSINRYFLANPSRWRQIARFCGRFVGLIAFLVPLPFALAIMPPVPDSFW